MAQRRATQGAAVRGAPRPVDVVGWVLNRGEARLGARLLRVRSPQPEEGAQPRHPVVVARDGGDGPQGRGAGAAREAQEDRLSLVVHRVAEEDRGAFALGDRSQGGSAGVAGRTFGPSRAVHRHGLNNGTRPQGGRQIRDAASLLAAARAQPMVDGHRHNGDSRARGHIDRRQRQRQRIRAARQADDESGRGPGLVDERGQRSAHREGAGAQGAARVCPHEA